MRRLLALSLLLAAAPAASQPAQAPATGSLGLSYLASRGNAPSSSIGLDFTLKRPPEPWGYDLATSYLRAEEDGVRTTDRTLARARLGRATGKRWSAFLGVSGERDRFAGLDARLVAEAGSTWRPLEGPRHDLSFDIGFSYTREERVDEGVRRAPGTVVGTSYAFRPREGTSLTQRMVAYPSWRDSSDWRFQSDTALQTALAGWLAVKLGYTMRYDNRPVPGYGTTDSTTTVSLVITFKARRADDRHTAADRHAPRN